MGRGYRPIFASFCSTTSLLFRILLKYQTRVIHDLIITDNSFVSCLILIYTACGCCVHVSCHVWQSFPVCKIMCMCTRATTGISVLILNAFSSMESEGVSAYAKTRQNLIYSLLQSLNVLKRGSKWHIQHALHWDSHRFLFLFFFSACWNLFIFC